MNLPELTETAKLVLEQYDATRFRWEYRNGRALFSAFFAYEPEPDSLNRQYMPLLVSYKPTTPEDMQHWSHLYEVRQDRQGMLYTDPMLHQDYGPLLDVLGIARSRGQSPFRSSDFLRGLQRAAGGVPGHWKHHRIRTIQDIPASCRSDVEEPDAIYFCGWYPNPKGKHPTVRNLEKTRRFLGTKIAQACQELRLSSCWTTDKHLMKPLPTYKSIVEIYARQSPARTLQNDSN